MKPSTSARSPLSPTLWPRSAFIWWRSLGLLLLLFSLLVVAGAFFLGVALGFGLATMHDLTTLSWPVIVAQVLAYAFPLAALLTLLPMLAQRPLHELGLRPPRASDVGWGLAGAVAMIAATEAGGLVQQAVFHLKADEVQVQWLRSAHGPLLAAYAALACLAAPVFEELAFRGFLFNALLRYMPVWLAAPLSAIVFGFAHFSQGNAGAIAPLAAGGVVLALVYYRTGSLAASMITHAVFNAATFFAVTVLHQTG